MSSNGIVVVGSCMIDFVSYAPRLPTAGETIHGKTFVTNFGGKGANQCVASAKLGGNTTLVARVGDDIWGQKYIDNLSKENIHTQHVKITDNSSTGIAQIIVSESGDNQIVIVAGANNLLCLNDLEEAKESIKNAAVLVVQLETAEEVAIKAVKMCKGVTILNGAPALSDFSPELLTSPTIFCVNESEASVFAGLPITDKEEARAAANKLLSKGCQNVLITLGSQGAVFLNGVTGKHHEIRSPAVTCIDSTGAGDAFIGALAYLVANRKDLSIEDCIEISCVVAADSVTRPGTQISFPGPDILNKCKKCINI